MNLIKNPIVALVAGILLGLYVVPSLLASFKSNN